MPKKESFGYKQHIKMGAREADNKGGVGPESPLGPFNFFTEPQARDARARSRGACARFEQGIFPGHSHNFREWNPKL